MLDAAADLYLVRLPHVRHGTSRKSTYAPNDQIAPKTQAAKTPYLPRIDTHMFRGAKKSAVARIIFHILLPCPPPACHTS